MTRAAPPLCSTASFSARCSPPSPPSARAKRIASAIRSSSSYSPANHIPSAFSISSGAAEVRKPRCPRLIPSTGVLPCATTRAPRSSVPSPPSVSSSSSDGTTSGVSAPAPDSSSSSRSSKYSSAPSRPASDTRRARASTNCAYRGWPTTPMRRGPPAGGSGGLKQRPQRPAQERPGAGGDPVGGEAELGQQLAALAVLHEGVRQPHGGAAHPRPALRHVPPHECAEAVHHRPLLHREQVRVAGEEPLQRGLVERLDEAAVDHRRPHPLALELLGGGERGGHHR